ncbi:MAG TPA: hypothetical protein VF796_31145 [Humisphaera sp.]
MDFSKLPKLSSSGDRAGASGGIDDEAPRRRSGGPDDEGMPLFDLFLTIGIGLLFLFLSPGYGKYLKAKWAGQPYDTGLVWQEGNAAGKPGGSPVAAEEMNEPGRTDFLVGGASILGFGWAMLVAGAISGVTKIGVLPLRARQAAAGLAFVLVAAATLWSVYAILALMKVGLTPLVSFVAVLLGGMTLYVQAAVVRYLLDERPPARDPAASAAGGNVPAVRPRKVHHRFAHHALRQQVLGGPARVVGVLQGPGGERYVKDLWEAVRREENIAEPDADATGLSTEMTQVGPYSSAVVTMPKPAAPGEAYFVGIVLRSYQRADGAVIERSPLLLYYTLERQAGTAPPAASLCEWQAGDHVRFAGDVAPTLSAFREAMWQKVQARQSAEDRGA